jgi:transcriptional antiterminator RfaH
MLWYAVQTKARQEDLAVLNLNRYGIQTLNPKLQETKLVKGETRTVIKPLFPGYIFSRFDLATSMRAVKYAHGVRGIVTFGEKPTPVDDEIIAIIETRMRDGVVRIEPTFQPGDQVLVESGPLRGFVGIFERQMSGTERVVILLEAISYQARFVVDRVCLKKL